MKIFEYNSCCEDNSPNTCYSIEIKFEFIFEK